MNDSEHLDRYLDDFGARLAAGAAAGDLARPRGHRRRALVALAVGAAATGAVVLAVPSERGLNPVARGARRARRAR